MSGRELTVDGKPLSALRVVDLKDELEKRGLSKSGSKKDLAERLKVHLQIEKHREGASRDDEQLPNISMQEKLAEQNPFIRDYFASQAELYHSQKVVKKLYEEETRKESEASSASADEGCDSPVKEKIIISSGERSKVRKLVQHFEIQSKEKLEESQKLNRSSKLDEGEEKAQGSQKEKAVVEADRSERRLTRIRSTEVTRSSITKEGQKVSVDKSVIVENKPALASVSVDIENKQSCEEMRLRSKEKVSEEQPENSETLKSSSKKTLDSSNVTEKEKSNIETPPNTVLEDKQKLLSKSPIKKRRRSSEKSITEENASLVIEMCPHKIAKKDDSVPSISVGKVELQIEPKISLNDDTSLKDIPPNKKPISSSEELDKKNGKGKSSLDQAGSPLKTMKQRLLATENMAEGPSPNLPVQKVESLSSNFPCKEDAAVTPEISSVEISTDEKRQPEILQDSAVKVDLKDDDKGSVSKPEKRSSAVAGKDTNSVEKKGLESEKASDKETEKLPSDLSSATPAISGERNSVGKDEPPLKISPEQTSKCVEKTQSPEPQQEVVETSATDVSTDVNNENSSIEGNVSEKESLVTSTSTESTPFTDAISSSLDKHTRNDNKSTSPITDNPDAADSKGLNLSSSLLSVKSKIKPDQLEDKKIQDKLEAKENTQSQNATVQNTSEEILTNQQINSSKVEETLQPKRKRLIASPEKKLMSPVEAEKDESDRAELELHVNTTEMDIDDDEPPKPTKGFSIATNTKVKEAEQAIKLTERSRRFQLSRDKFQPKKRQEMSDSSSSTESRSPNVVTSRQVSVRTEEMDEEALDYGDEEKNKDEPEKFNWSGRMILLENKLITRIKERKWRKDPTKKTNALMDNEYYKKLYADVNPAAITELKLEEKSPVRVERKIEIIRKVSLDVKDRELPLPSNDVDSKPIIRKVSIVSLADENEKELTPPRNPPTNFIIVTSLVRPFTLPQLKDLLQRTGNIVDIWVDKIKSKCIAKFETEAQALETRSVLHGVKWPATNSKPLQVDFSTEESFEDHKAKETGDTKPIVEKPNVAQNHPVREWDMGKRSRSRSPSRVKRRSRSPSRDRKRGRRSHSPHRRRHSRTPTQDRKGRGTDTKDSEPTGKALDELFRKTVAAPSIYWLPLTPQQIAEKEDLRRRRMQERERRLAELSKLRPR